MESEAQAYLRLRKTQLTNQMQLNVRQFKLDYLKKFGNWSLKLMQIAFKYLENCF